MEVMSGFPQLGQGRGVQRGALKRFASREMGWPSPFLPGGDWARTPSSPNCSCHGSLGAALCSPGVNPQAGLNVRIAEDTMSKMCLVAQHQGFSWDWPSHGSSLKATPWPGLHGRDPSPPSQLPEQSADVGQLPGAQESQARDGAILLPVVGLPSASSALLHPRGRDHPGVAQIAASQLIELAMVRDGLAEAGNG